ncbi:hypothetical protein STEG23_010992, partial [Scotinomys teguina]
MSAAGSYGAAGIGLRASWTAGVNERRTLTKWQHLCVGKIPQRKSASGDLSAVPHSIFTEEGQIKMNAMLETPELPAVFDGVKLAAVAAVLYVIVRCLNLKSPTAPPDLYFQDSGLSRFLLKSCPLLTK